MNKEIYECCLVNQLPTVFIPVEADSHKQAASMYAAYYYKEHPDFLEGTIRVGILCRKEYKDFKVVAVPCVTFNATPV